MPAFNNFFVILIRLDLFFISLKISVKKGYAMNLMLCETYISKGFTYGFTISDNPTLLPLFIIFFIVLFLVS